VDPDYTRLSIIIPMYNEESTIARVLDEIAEVNIGAITKEIIAVDDGSTDHSAAIVQQFAERSPLDINLVISPENQGKGAAIRRGLEHITGDIVLIQDADIEYDPQDYPQLLAPILSGEAQVVYGTRFHHKIKGMALPNRLANWILPRLANLLYGTHLTDEATAYKVFAAEVIRSINLRCVGFEFCPEVTAKIARAGHKIHEVPISYTPRGTQAGKKIRWTDGVAAIWTLIKYRFMP